jgi:hypothetical protein
MSAWNPAHPCYPGAAFKVVVAIVGVVAGGQLLMAFVMIGLGGACRRSDFARLDAGNLHHAAKLFHAKTGRLPTGTGELVSKQFLEKDPLDPWGNPYRYWIVRGEPTFVSLGADGACDGEDEAADVIPGYPEPPLPGECAWRDR